MNCETRAALVLLFGALGCSDAGAEGGGAAAKSTDDGEQNTDAIDDGEAIPDDPGAPAVPPGDGDGDGDGSRDDVASTGGVSGDGDLGMMDGTGGQTSDEPNEPTNVITDGPLKIVWKDTASVTINTGTGVFNYDVDWDDDGVFDEVGVTGPVSHEYGGVGDHTVAIRGDFPHMVGNCAIDIVQWGSIAWSSFRSSFDRCSGTVISATDVPDLSNVTDMAFAFARSDVEFGPAFGNWDTSNVTTMQNMFRHSSGFNEDISGWDTSSVQDMELMFWKAFAFDQDIGGWDTSSVTDMRIMFQHARAFNQDLGQWDVTGVTSMENMFGSSAMDTTNYDATLNGWASQSSPTSRTLIATGRTYCEAADARQTLMAAGWTIEGDTLQCE